MTNSSKLPQIQKKAFDLALHSITHYSKGYAERIFDEDIGKQFLEDLLQVPQIGRFQWDAIEGPSYSILRRYLQNFLIDLIIFANRNSLISKSKEVLINNNEFEVLFNKQYNRLESGILLDDYFKYKILIPAFGILLKDTKIIALNPNYIIRNITDIAKINYLIFS